MAVNRGNAISEGRLVLALLCTLVEGVEDCTCCARASAPPLWHNLPTAGAAAASSGAMVLFQPPAAGGVVAPSSGRDVLKADPTGTGMLVCGDMNGQLPRYRSSTAKPRYAEAAERIRRRTRLEEYLKTRNWLTTDDVGLATLPALQALRDADYTDPTFTFEDIVLHRRPSRKQPSPARRKRHDVRRSILRTAARYPFGGDGLKHGMHSNTLFNGENEYGPISRCANSGGLSVLRESARADLVTI